MLYYEAGTKVRQEGRIDSSMRYELEIECPKCCGRGYGLDGSGSFTHSTGTCDECNGKCRIKNACKNCGSQIKHNEGYLVCSIKCFVQFNSGKKTYFS